MANVCRNKSSATIQHNRRDSQVPSSGPLCCPLCPAIFTSRSHFLCHVGSTHPGSFFAACKTCGQSFAPHEITAHVATCKGAHVCVHCRQTFALLSYLKRHIRRRHSHEQEVTGVATAVVPRFVCKFCSKNFSSNNSLNNHIRGHLGACVCSICGTALVYERHNELVDCTACGNQMSFNSSEFYYCIVAKPSCYYKLIFFSSYSFLLCTVFMEPNHYSKVLFDFAIPICASRQHLAVCIMPQLWQNNYQLLQFTCIHLKTCFPWRLWEIRWYDLVM